MFLGSLLTLVQHQDAPQVLNVLYTAQLWDTGALHLGKGEEEREKTEREGRYMRWRGGEDRRWREEGGAGREAEKRGRGRRERGSKRVEIVDELLAGAVKGLGMILLASPLHSLNMTHH